MRLKLVALLIVASGWLNESFSQEWRLDIDKADSFAKQNLFDSSIFYYLKAKKNLDQDSALSLVLLNINKQLVKAYFKTNQVKETPSLFAEIKNSIDKKFGLATIEYANWNEQAGILFFESDDYLQAKVFFIQLKNIWKQLNKEKEYARACNLLGISQMNLGEYSSAEEVLLEALTIRERLFTKQSNEYAQICNNLGDVYRRKGDYDKAEELSVEAKEIRSRIFGSNSLVFAISCVNLANVYRDIGQYKKAETLYLVAKKIRKDSIDQSPSLYASSCNILADLYYYMQEHNKAEALYLEAKAIREKVFTKLSYSYAQSCNNLAGLYQGIGRLKEAEALALEAKGIYEQVLPKGHPTFPINYNNLADLYLELGDLQQAENYYSTARDLWEQSVGKTHPYYTLNTFGMAKLFWNKKVLTKSRDFFIEGLRANFTEIDKVFQFTNEVQKQSYLKSIHGSVDDFLSFEYKAMDYEKAGEAYQVSLSNRNLILSSGKNLKAFLNNATDSTTKKLYDEWRNTKERIAFLYTREPGVGNTKKSLEDKAEELEKQLARRSSSFLKNGQNTSWKEIQEKLQVGEASIEFAEFDLRNEKGKGDSILYVALLLRKDRSEPKMIPLFEKKQLSDLLQNVRNNGSMSLYNTVEQANISARRLYQLLWKPLENDLKEIQKIFFAPAGLLHRISFGAISIGGGRVTSDQYNLQQVTSTAAIPDIQPDYVTASNNMYAYGAILYDADTTELKKAGYPFHTVGRPFFNEETRGSRWEYLEGTEKEMNLIETLGILKKYSVTTKKGVAANEESFKALNGSSSPALLHIATHGFFFPDPAQKKTALQKTVNNESVFELSDNPLFRTGLLFAGANYAWTGKPVASIEDGILTAYEVSNLYLPNTKLVILSACETALGDIQGSEGVYGLQRAFKMAGVQKLIMSLWKVPDAETAEFMEVFYDNLFKEKSVNEAFYIAQTNMKNKYRSQPQKWAAWVLVL